jgi:hypothetical protein
MVVNRIENNSSRHETKTPKMLLKLTINTSEDSLRGRPSVLWGAWFAGLPRRLFWTWLPSTNHYVQEVHWSFFLVSHSYTDEKQYPNSLHTLPESTSLCLVSVYVTLGSIIKTRLHSQSDVLSGSVYCKWQKTWHVHICYWLSGRRSLYYEISERSVPQVTDRSRTNQNAAFCRWTALPYTVVTPSEPE